ncbi:MAG: glycosyl hydrolase 115 family protein [Calditrichaceae bacterium]
MRYLLSMYKNIRKEYFPYSLISVFCFVLFFYPPAHARDSQREPDSSYLITGSIEGYFPLVSSGEAVGLYASSKDYPGVLRVLKHFQNDIMMVTSKKPQIIPDIYNHKGNAVIIGSIDKSPVIRELIQSKKIDVSDIRGKWEATLIQVIDQPFQGIDRALIIAGSDKRGTIYGMFDVSEKMGVSPWYWWADVPVRKNKNIYIKPGRHLLSEPAVKYRGIFINDEEPALGGWVREKFGGFNAKFYQHVFELILRLKGNFLWPAMWGKAFYDDDPENPRLADEYGVVISTSHHEPMMRAHVEWQRYGSGPWNYEKNEAKLKAFWRKGIERMDDYESIVTLAMRGDGDEAMSDEANVGLLERIVKDQREIIKEVTGKKLEEIPQVWALYKEVQEYYDKGMRVPDDVTILLCDDNWGNIRKLPKLDAPPRSGGYGIYYHFDYVGGPRNYKWLNTNPIARTWEQMHLAHEYGANRIWVVNVGDIKPMEFSISFFLDYARNPDAIPASSLPEYTRMWAEKQFGEKYSQDIADILTAYLKFNSRRKPELLSPDTYSLVHYREAERVLDDYNALAKKAEDIYAALPDEMKAAFYELVLYPVQACANLNDLYITTGKNRLYAQQGRVETNALAEKAELLFEKDAKLSEYYNKELAGGKWNHMMDQTHIGYTYWQEPPQNNMPEVREIDIPENPEMGVAIQGSGQSWPNDSSQAVLPVFDPYNDQKFYIDIFNRGKKPFKYKIVNKVDWLNLSLLNGEIENEQRLWIRINWDKAPEGQEDSEFTVQGDEGSAVNIKIRINNPENADLDQIEAFIESNGYISIEAAHYSNKIASSGIDWLTIPDFGRTLSGVTPVPVTAVEQTPKPDSPHLEYRVFLFDSGEVTVNAYLAPTLNFHNNPKGIRYAVSIDDEEPQLINMTSNPNPADLNYDPVWNKWVSNNINIQKSTHSVAKAGLHTLKFWMVDPAVVLEKIVIETEEIPESYLGPPESYNSQFKK